MYLFDAFLLGAFIVSEKGTIATTLSTFCYYRNMLIQPGLKHKKVLGIKQKIKAPDFHEQFGSLTTLPTDFNLSLGLYPSFDQNSYNTVFNTPAQPMGCTGMATGSVMTNLLKVPINPYFTYQQTCLAEYGSLNGQGCELVYALNEPVTVGLLALGETTTTQALARKTPPWWEVTPINGSLFQGIVSAMSIGGACVSYAGTWWESYESPVNGIVPQGTGAHTAHNWVFSGVMTINGIPYLIAESFLGANWGGNAERLKGGFCLFSEAEINGNGGQGFTPKESPNANIPAPITVESIMEALLNALKRLLGIETVEGNPLFDQLESEEQFIQKELDKLFKPMPQPMNPIPAPTNPDSGPLLWDTPQHCYHAVRVLCDLAGLSLNQKNILCACIYQESQFHTQAKHENLNADGTVSSTDWGICQINDYFHIAPTGTPFASVADVLNNPEVDVRWMINCYLSGEIIMWSSYTTGAYRQWLNASSPMWALSPSQS